MSTSNRPTQIDVQSLLDDLFHRRMTLASLPQERDAAILRQLPPEWHETVAGILQEFAERQAQEETEQQALEEQIRLAGKTLGVTIQGTYLQMTYTPGRRSWDSYGLERFAERVPEVLSYRKQGEPVVTIRTRTMRRRTTPLLYDIHGLGHGAR